MKLREKPLSYDEWEVLRILWDAGESLSRTEIFEKLPNSRKWNQPAVSNLLASMVEKEFLVIDGSKRCGKRSWGRSFKPTQEQFDFIADYSINLTSNVPKRKGILGVVSSLMSQNEIGETHKRIWKLVTPLMYSNNIKEETIEKLEQLISESECEKTE